MCLLSPNGTGRYRSRDGIRYIRYLDILQGIDYLLVRCRYRLVHVNILSINSIISFKGEEFRIYYVFLDLKT